MAGGMPMMSGNGLNMGAVLIDNRFAGGQM